MEISGIKERLTLAEVLKHYGLKPDKNLRLHCPFHPDTTPSLQVYYKTHTCYGFGGHEKDDEIKGTGNHLSFNDYGYYPNTPQAMEEILPLLL